MLKFNNLNLVQKSSLVIGCLLSFELVMLFFLDRALADAEKDLWRTSMAKAAAVEAALLQSALTECATSLVRERFAYKELGVKTPVPSDVSPYVTRLADRARSLKLLLEDIPDSAAARKTLDDLDQRMMRMISVSIKTGTNPAELLHTITDIDLCLKEMSAILAQLQSISESQVSSIKQTARARLTRQTVRRMILAGALLNIVVVAALALVFNCSIAARLQVIQSNAARFSRKEDLLAPLSGTDEIAEVDRSFHTMAEQLVELDRLKRQFFASISHDIRSPLNSIYATLSLLCESRMFPLPDPVLLRLRNASRSCNRVIGIVNDFLDLEKIEEGQLELSFEQTCLSDCVLDAVNELQGLIEQKGLIIEKCLADIVVSADRLWLTQVVTNLLANAIKFSPDKGVIKLRLISITCGAKVEISDQGPGVAPEEQESIFGWFRQTGDQKRKRGSSGLGLAIACQIVKKHGGDIGIVSASGCGSTFWFTVPANSFELRPQQLPETGLSKQTNLPGFSHEQ